MEGVLCEKCVSGYQHSGQATGRIDTLHNLSTYIADPPHDQAPKGIIVFVTDVFGYTLSNNQLLSDRLAHRTGCQVLMPDVFDGNWIDASKHLKNFDVMGADANSVGEKIGKIIPTVKVVSVFAPFLYTNRQSIVVPRIRDFLKAVRAAAEPGLKIGGSGFCWGARPLVTLAAAEEKNDEGKPLVDALFLAHPSMLEIPKDGELLAVPTSVSVGDVDSQLPLAKANELSAILKAKGPDNEVVVIPGAKHGFAIRGHPGIAVEMKQAQQCEDQSVEWFKKQLVKPEARI